MAKTKWIAAAGILGTILAFESAVDFIAQKILLHTENISTSAPNTFIFSERSPASEKEREYMTAESSISRAVKLGQVARYAEINSLSHFYYVPAIDLDEISVSLKGRYKSNSSYKFSSLENCVKIEASVQTKCWAHEKILKIPIKTPYFRELNGEGPYPLGRYHVETFEIGNQRYLFSASYAFYGGPMTLMRRMVNNIISGHRVLEDLSFINNVRINKH